MPATDFNVNSATLEAVTLLLFRWERDCTALCDYRTREEQDALLWKIEHTLAHNFLHNRNWSPESAAYWARAYRKALEARLTNPQFFNPALPPRQQDAPDRRGPA